MKQVSKQVPVIVKIISILYYIGAVTSVIVGILLMVGGGMLGNYLENYGALFSGLAIVGGILMVVFGVVGFFIGRGLWKAKQWARIVVIILSALGVISAIVSLAQGATSSIVSLLISAQSADICGLLKKPKKHSHKFLFSFYFFSILFVLVGSQELTSKEYRRVVKGNRYYPCYTQQILAGSGFTSEDKDKNPRNCLDCACIYENDMLHNIKTKMRIYKNPSLALEYVENGK